ncbi:PilC/PilY family type IV pilus protein [Acinetobacter sp. AND/436]|uniref:PilC/PilY family type IV pilus protein n=1 Tax=Acinetobacter sp. AND/436 TaxID=3414736 RepID=UPI003C3019CF
MKSNKFNQGLATSLTALATAMLCQTTATYASDIEIYKAPTQGGAIIQLILDMSSSMQTPVNNSGGYQNPINKDFQITCATGRNGGNNKTYGETRAGIAYEKTDTRTFIDSATPADSHQYTFTGRYCNILQSDVNILANGNASNKAKANLITKSCTLFRHTTTSGTNTDFYRCPDRLTSLKHSIFDLIIGTSDVERLPDTAYIGITTFPNSNTLSPVLLDDAGRKIVLAHVDGLTTASGTPISQGYANATKTLLDFTSNNNAAAACAGFGLYFLTDGEPLDDNRSTARTTVNSYLKSDQQITTSQCSGSIGLTESDKSKQALSWSCVEPIAKKLQEKHNTRTLEIKTAVVGFGGDFSFKDSSGQPIQFTTSMTETQAANLFSGAIQKAAARAATAGKGGWFSADNSEDIVNSVQNFVTSIQIEIPSITTGTPAIPQDTLNSSVVQPYAYFPQFQPTPSEMTQAWVGNLKKYKVIDGLLKDKADRDVFSSAGVLNLNAEDLWVKNYAANTNLTETQQKLKNLGGLLGRLNLKTDDGAFNRKVYTNAGQNVSKVNKAYIEEAPTSRGYFLGLLGYQIPKTEVDVLTAAQVENIVAGMTPKDELRQMGAILHSTPVLLTQSGKITFTNNVVDTTNRDDYILVGTTQGALHVIKAGTHSESAVTSIIDNTAGEEVFTFVPEEMLSSQPEALLAPTETPTAGMENLFYGVDGQWVAHTEYVYIPGTDTQPEGEFKVYHDDNKYGKQWVYGGMRMGGKSYYALDLTRLTAAEDNGPKVKFRINPDQSRVDGFTTPSAESTRYANLSKMGQSWSKPTIANVQWKGKRRLVMFVGGGYDPDYENFDYDQTNGMGAGVYMFDADTGEFLWSTYDAKDTATGSTKTLIGDGDHLKYSVVSQIKTVDRDGDGDVDHLYFGDLGGQVFRVDLDKDHPSSGTYADYAKQITRIYNGNTNNDKFAGYSPRFYEMPTFTVYGSGDDLFAVVSIGSGNRSTPLLGKVVNGKYVVENEAEDVDDPINSNFINDAIYNIYDKVVTQEKPHDVTLSTSPVLTDLHALTNAQRELAATSSTSPTPSNLATWKEGSTLKGWYYPFTSSANIGTRKAVEKVQGELIAIDNDLYVSTFDAEGVGTTEACGAGIYGNSRAHRFCMPYGQCANGDTVADNTVVLGKGLLGITVGPGSSTGDRRIIAPLNTTMGNKITSQNYKSLIKLTPQSWYEKN